jgi:hypothetical protein
MIIQPTEERSEVTLVVELAVVRALMTKLVPAVIVPIDNMPSGAAPVAPGDIRVSMMMELAVTAVVATVAVPNDRVTVPNELAPAAVVVATLVDMILFPATPRMRLPLVATDPGATKAAGVLNVTVLPADVAVTCPAVPAMTILPAVGLRLLIVATAPVAPPRTIQVAIPADLDANPYIVAAVLSTASVPRRCCILAVLGAPDVDITSAGLMT